MKEEIKQCITYVAEDGRRFTCKEDCHIYEIELKRPKVYMVILRYSGFRSGENLVGICSTRRLAEILMNSEQTRWNPNCEIFIEETILIDS